jgi:hypothetical protein
MPKAILTFRCNRVNRGFAFLKFLKFENTYIMLFVISGTTLWTSTSFQLCWRLCLETKRVDPIPWTLSSAMKSSTSSTKAGWDVCLLLLLRFNIFNKDVRLLLILFFKRQNQFNIFNKDCLVCMNIFERSVQCFNAGGTLKFCHLKCVITIIGKKLFFITVLTNVGPLL